MDEALRQAFEAWITQPPFEKVVSRFPDDAAVAAWPGQYRDVEVQLAWLAWQESFKIAKDSIPQ